MRQNGNWDGPDKGHSPTEQDIHEYIDKRLAESSGVNLKLRSFSDFQAFISIGVILVGAIAWGVKLDSKINSTNSEVNECKATLARGILPITEERLNALNRRLDLLEKIHDDLKDIKKQIGK